MHFFRLKIAVGLDRFDAELAQGGFRLGRQRDGRLQPDVPFLVDAADSRREADLLRHRPAGDRQTKRIEIGKMVDHGEKTSLRGFA